jgi:hypothetical protein
MLDQHDIAVILARFDETIRLLEECQRRNPQPEYEHVLAAMKKARNDLAGKKTN